MVFNLKKSLSFKFSLFWLYNLCPFCNWYLSDWLIPCLINKSLINFMEIFSLVSLVSFLNFLFIYFRLCCCTGFLPLVAGSGGYSNCGAQASHCYDFSVLRSTGSTAHKLRSCSSWALEHRLNSCGAWT